MNRILRNSLTIGGIVTASTLLIIYFRNQFKLLADACYNIVGGTVHNISQNDVKITLFFKIKNKSDLSVTLSNAIFDVYVNNMFVSKVLRKEKQKILSNSDIIFKIDVQF